MKQIRQWLTYANVMSSIAVFLVLGGATAYAAKKIGSHDLKSNSVTTAKIKKNAVTAKKIRNNAVTTNKIKNGAVTGPKVNLATLGSVPSADSLVGYQRKGIVRVTATNGASFAAAREAAPENTFFSAGPFTVYAKCFSTGGTTYAYFYAKTSQGESIFNSNSDSIPGNPFFEPSTPEESREIESTSAATNASSYYGVHSPEFTAMAPDGTVVKGEVQMAVKTGDLPGGNGIYGAGDVCLLAADMRAMNG